jgi:hypothetical protein
MATLRLIDSVSTFVLYYTGKSEEILVGSFPKNYKASRVGLICAFVGLAQASNVEKIDLDLGEADAKLLLEDLKNGRSAERIRLKIALQNYLREWAVA